MYHQSQQYTQQQQQFSQQPLSGNQFENVHTPPEEEAEIVPEAESVKRNRKGKGKGKQVAESSERPKGQRVSWSAEENKILAERWVDASQNGAIGNSQTGDSFWKVVQENYNRCVDKKCNLDQITGKWTKLQRDVKVFQSIYQKYQNEWQSGMTDIDIMLAAREGFKDRTNRNFLFESPWRVLKDVPKFFFPEGVMNNKRPMEDKDYKAVNLDEEDNDPHQAKTPNFDNDPHQAKTPNFDNLFADDTIRRPPGRAQSKKRKKSSGSSDATSSRVSADKVRAQLLKTALAQQKTMKTLAEIARKKSMFRVFKVLNNPINPNLPPEEQEFLRSFREEVKRDCVAPTQHTNEDTDED